MKSGLTAFPRLANHRAELFKQRLDHPGRLQHALGSRAFGAVTFAFRDNLDLPRDAGGAFRNVALDKRQTFFRRGETVFLFDEETPQHVLPRRMPLGPKLIDKSVDVRVAHKAADSVHRRLLPQRRETRSNWARSRVSQRFRGPSSGISPER